MQTVRPSATARDESWHAIEPRRKALKDKLQITAYEAIEQPVALRTAQRARNWIEDLPERFAYRCLPLAIANQVGWELLNPVAFTASWNGKDGLDAIKIRFHDEPSPLIGSHFGHGVLTFTPGYLFRTTKSHNLYVKGPATGRRTVSRRSKASSKPTGRRTRLR